MARPLHVVQLGYDDTVFVQDAPSDTRRRQALYGRLLDARRPGSRLTLVVLTGRRGLRPVDDGCVTFIPISGPRPLRLMRLVARLAGLHRERPVDVLAPQTIFADGWAALAFGARAKVPVVGQVHFDLFGGPDAAAGPGHDVPAWRMWLACRLLRRFAALRVVSRHLAAEIARRRLHTRVTVLPVPATMSGSAAPAGPGPALPLAPGRHPTVLHVGRLVTQKNLSRWLRVARRVAARVPEVALVWAGDGPSAPALRAEAERLGLASRLDWRGPVAYADLPALYAGADVFLLTSDYEGLPRVAIEAGLHGVPVVAPALPGLEDVVVSGETGVLCPPGDEGALADAVIRLLHDPVLRSAMAERGRARVRREFDPERLASRWVDMLVATAEARA